MSNTEETTPEQRLDSLAEALEAGFAEQGCRINRAFGELTMEVPEALLLGVAETLREREEFRFAELIDLCGVDYSSYGQSEWVTDAASVMGFGRGVAGVPEREVAAERRFAVVYHLLSISHNRRLRIKVFVDGDQPIVPSVVDIWTAANWFEREAFDLFGILFDGHPDLRRILTDYGFVGHPFRKDFPLTGQVEMRYDPEQQRVIYEPVKIEPRTLVPRVVREDNRYTTGTGAGNFEEKGTTDA